MRLFTPEERAVAAEQVVALLRADGRVVDTIVMGSLALGTEDAYSDVDIAARVAPDADLEEVAADCVRRMYAELRVVHHFEIRFDGPVRGFLLDNLLEIDVGFTHEPLVADSYEEDPDVYTREAGFAWHDVLHAVFALRRGRPWRALYYLEQVRRRVITLACARLALRSSELKDADDLPADVLMPMRETLVAAPDPAVLLDATRTATRLFLSELRAGDGALADRLERPLLELLE